MSEKQTLPLIKLAEALNPSHGYDDGLLHYDTLTHDVAKYTRDHPERQLRLEQSPPGSTAELRAGQQIAAYYLLKSAEKLNGDLSTDARNEWAKHFTEASIQLCGKPDASTARHLEEHGIGERFADAASATHDYLVNRYGSVFSALDLDDSPREIAPADITGRFRAGISLLARDFDPDWDEWLVVPEDGGDKLSASGQTATVTVGLNRADTAPHELKGLFAHEVLVHGLSAINGYKQSKELGDGLPQYLDFQEGLGGFVEYAMTGDVPEKIVDRYVDIAYALGQLDGKQHTRSEMIVRNLARAEKRNETADVRTDEIDMRKTAIARANRIYRGTRGDEHVGVFTKDIAYYRGFMAVGEYVDTQLADGHPIDAILDYLLQGKFDPRNPAHTEAVRYPLG